MAEVKNAFIKSKMNKDLDDRLIPSGEYRNALNVQVSKSESSDVGALENVLGNSKTPNGDYALPYAVNKITANSSQTGKIILLNSIVGLKIGMLFPTSKGNIKISSITSVGYAGAVTLDTETDITISASTPVSIVYDINCIGYFTDDFNNNIYSFFTDYIDNSGGISPDYSIQAKNFIFKHNISTNNVTTLALGSWLNFSKTNPITGVNLLEDLLFFTDNRNQPRKINVNQANNNTSDKFPTYYTNEDQVSVAKYNPYDCIKVFTTIQDQASLSGAKKADATSSANSNSKVIEINPPVNTPIGPISVGDGIDGQGVKDNTFVVAYNSQTQQVTTNKIQNIPSGTALVFAGLQTSMRDVSNSNLPNGDTNPYYNADYGGDPKFLKDKFIRFSYRFEFDDGENSIFAPFTQPCFIPKQDGYFVGQDEKDAYESTIVSFMENKVTEIQLQIPLPANGSSLANSNSPYKIKAIDILYKESDELAVKVVETIQVDSAFGLATGDNNVYRYDYQSTKPFKTLPSKELIRVYDKIPVKALSQEIISNRVVYANFQDKHTPPKALNYQVAVSDKYNKDSQLSNKTIVEYPSSTVKQNRNYQVGIVLSDKYGRQSSTLLSNKIGDLSTGLTAGFGSSTVYSPYFRPSDTSPSVWPGDSLKVLFNDIIDSQVNSITGTPGLYNGDDASDDYNPLGWYSYKVVVQQKEQDYYNIYNAGAIAGDPLDDTADISTSYITLVSDNINKVPRDLSEIGPQQKQFRSSVRLVGRVQNTSITQNKQYYPGTSNNGVSTESTTTFSTSSIENLRDVFDVAGFENNASTPELVPITSNQNAYSVFFKAESNALIARISTGLKNGGFGLGNAPVDPAVEPSTYSTIDTLTIFEADPTVSLLDLYFETSTSGLISDLNEAITTGRLGAVDFNYWDFYQTEQDETGSTSAGGLNGGFIPIDQDNTNVFNTEVTLVVKNGSNTEINGWFLEKTGNGTVGDPHKYTVKTNAYQYYGPNSNQIDSYTFNFIITDLETSITNFFTKTGVLVNIAPTIDGGANQSVNLTRGQLGVINSQTGLNGTSDTNRNTSNLTWTKLSGKSNLTISDDGDITNSNNAEGGEEIMEVRVTDAGGLFAESTIIFTFGNSPVPTRFLQDTGVITDGGSQVYYFVDTNDATPAEYSNINSLSRVVPLAEVESNGTSDIPTKTDKVKSGYVCSTENQYEWKKEIATPLDDNIASEGSFKPNNKSAFYVQVFTDAKEPDNNVLSPVSVEYRLLDETPGAVRLWRPANDLNYQSSNFAEITGNTGTPGNFASTKVRFRYDSSTSPLATITSDDVSNVDNYRMEVFNPANPSNENSVVGSRIFAFNGINDPSNTSSSQGAEVRVTIGNFKGSNMSFPSCLSTPKTSSSGTQRLVMGDASYNGNQDSYEYRIGEGAGGFNQNCNTAFSSTSYYAKEWITKYVTQLYTDPDLTTKATLGTGSQVNLRVKFKRNGVNQEGTVDGAYVGFFNSQGLRDKVDTSLPVQDRVLIANEVYGCISST